MKKIVFTMLALFILACSMQVERSPPAFDVVDDDILTLMKEQNISSPEVGVLGVKLGDSKNFVISTLGVPSNFTYFEGEGLVIENLEYDFDYDSTAVIFSIHNGDVERITVRTPFNDRLHGLTAIDKDLEGIYFDFGVPDEKSIQWRYIVHHYNELGLDLITYLGDQIGFSLRAPTETDRNISTEVELTYIPYSSTIQFK